MTNDATVTTVFIYSLLGGVISLTGGLFLIRNKTNANKLAKYGTPFAAGALLSAVFIDLLPEGINSDSPEIVLMGCLLGFIGFFIMQRLLQSKAHHHHSDEEKDNHLESSRASIIIGNAAHNILDGVAIGAAFLVNVPTGIVTTIAIAAHEIPHEIGDFALLLSRKVKRKWVVYINICTAIASALVAVLVFAVGGSRNIPIGLLIGFSSGFLLYIAASDIVPSMNNYRSKSIKKDWQLWLFLAGVATVWAAIVIAERFIP